MLWGISPQKFAIKPRWGGGLVPARGIFAEAAARMATAGSARGVDGLTSKAEEVVWAGDLVPEADEAAEEGLPFRFFGVEEEGGIEYMLHGARTEARHGVEAEACNNGSEATRAGVRACACKGARGARVSVSDVVGAFDGEGAVISAQIKGGTEAKVGGSEAMGGGTADSLMSVRKTPGAVGEAHVK